MDFLPYPLTTGAPSRQMRANASISAIPTLISRWVVVISQQWLLPRQLCDVPVWTALRQKVKTVCARSNTCASPNLLTTRLLLRQLSASVFVWAVPIFNRTRPSCVNLRTSRRTVIATESLEVKISHAFVFFEDVVSMCIDTSMHWRDAFAMLSTVYIPLCSDTTLCVIVHRCAYILFQRVNFFMLV